MPAIDYAREMSATVPWSRGYRCEVCGAEFVSVYNVRHTASKMIDLLHDDPERDSEELRRRLQAEMPGLLERYHPRARCPGCGTVPAAVRAWHRLEGLKRGMLLGLVAGIAAALAGMGLPGPLWAYAAGGLAGGPVLGSLAGWWLSDRLFWGRDVVLAKDEWEKRLAASANERIALMKALRREG